MDDRKMKSENKARNPQVSRFVGLKCESAGQAWCQPVFHLSVIHFSVIIFLSKTKRLVLGHTETLWRGPPALGLGGADALPVDLYNRICDVQRSARRARAGSLNILLKTTG